MSLNIEEIVWTKHKQDILGIEKTCFSKKVASSASDLKEILSQGFGYIIFSDKDAIGYVMALPLEKTDYEGCIQDPHYGKSDTVYIESEAIKPGTNPYAFLMMARLITKEIKDRGYNLISLHTKSDNKLGQMITNFGGEKVSEHENFMNFGYNSTYFSLKI